MSFYFFHVWLPWQPKLPSNFHKIFIYVIRTLSLIFLWKISFLAQKVHVLEILRHFSQPYPTQSRYIFYIARCPICFLQNISLIGLVVLEKKSFKWFLPYMGMAAWTSSAGILSTPADFPFFSDATAISTSSRRNGCRSSSGGWLQFSRVLSPQLSWL